MSRIRIGNAYLQQLNQTVYKPVLEQIYKHVDLQKIRYQLISNKVYLDDIRATKHYVSPHFQGYNYLLGFFKINGQMYNVMIFKNLKFKLEQNNFNELKIYQIDMGYVNPELYRDSGTLIDGKLISLPDGKSSLIAYDIYQNAGRPTITIGLNEKLQIIDELIHKFRISENANMDCKICRLYSFDELPDLVFNKIKQSNLKINGLMFLPEFTSKYYIYTNDTEFEELKQSQTTQVIIRKNSTSQSESEFLMKKTSIPDVYELYSENETSQLYKEGIAHIPNMSTSHYFRKIFRDKNMCKVKCLHSEKFNKWIPLCDDYINYSEAIF